MVCMHIYRIIWLKTQTLFTCRNHHLPWGSVGLKRHLNSLISTCESWLLLQWTYEGRRHGTQAPTNLPCDSVRFWGSFFWLPKGRREIDLLRPSSLARSPQGLTAFCPKNFGKSSNNQSTRNLRCGTTWKINKTGSFSKENYLKQTSWLCWFIGIRDPLLTFWEWQWNLNTFLRRWLYTPIIIWQGDWIPRECNKKGLLNTQNLFEEQSCLTDP